MNTVQTFLSRLFRLEKPIDKRLLWALLASLLLIASLVANGITNSNDGASLKLDSNRPSNSQAFANQVGVGNAQSSNGLRFTAQTQAGLVSQPAMPSVYVHVVGEVKHPGLYVLNSGARLADAIVAAGGFTQRADQASVNLARQISDGEQIVVLRLQFGGPGPSGSGLSGSGLSGAASSGIGATSANSRGSLQINLNRGSESEIESLPGVGPTLAGRIIDWRTRNGGFKNKADLKKVAGIGDKLFIQLKDLVTL